MEFVLKIIGSEAAKFLFYLLATTFILQINLLFVFRFIHLNRKKVDPVNVVKTPKKITVEEAIKREEMKQDLLDRG